ncbi:hypothetical protein GGR20_002193 [Devosia subaequoris]|uniref:Uncharacterized protein n=1 Tax=Devosia subaequoris TaxID=395930 RepID=A0A7W6IMY2_9HYPH|nr:hypothetical protein [Devosia subaequoris]MBB4052545.1 hypothetical protein [Devosia subaequoris]MCP1209703.1 hypothetical protein [Devosia subaequoris]
MDQPDNAKAGSAPQAVAIDEVRPVARERSSTRHKRVREPAARGHAPRLPGLLAFGAVLFGIAAFAFSGWIYTQSRQDILRLSTQIAELRVSLDLYTRNGAENGSLASLQDRLTELEDSLASASVPVPTTASATPAANPTSSNQEDCLPVGMRLLVASGDAYAVCDQPGTIDVSVVDNGYITLADGTSVPSGGSMPLPGSPCMIAVTSGGDEGVTGYAEIRVSC